MYISKCGPKRQIVRDIFLNKYAVYKNNNFFSFNDITYFALN